MKATTISVWMLFLIALFFTAPSKAHAQQIGSQVLTCSSDNGRRQSCPSQYNPISNVQLIKRLSGSASCTQGRSWGFDTRGVWVDAGCRAQFQYGNNNSGGSDNTGAAIAAGILGAIVIGSIVASQNSSNNDDGSYYDQQRQSYWDGYRRGQRDWDSGLDPYYLRYRNRFSPQFENDFSAGYNDGFYNRPSRYR